MPLLVQKHPDGEFVVPFEVAGISYYDRSEQNKQAWQKRECPIRHRWRKTKRSSGGTTDKRPVPLLPSICSVHYGCSDLPWLGGGGVAFKILDFTWSPIRVTGLLLRRMTSWFFSSSECLCLGTSCVLLPRSRDVWVSLCLFSKQLCLWYCPYTVISGFCQQWTPETKPLPCI